MRKLSWIAPFIISLVLGLNIALPLLTGKNAIQLLTELKDNINNVVAVADEPPQPYIYWYPPENTFGIPYTKSVNWTYFTEFFLDHIDWLLRYKLYSASEWTNGNQYLTIERTWDDEEKYWKFNLILDVPVLVYQAEFVFGIDLPVLEYIERDGYEVWINYTVPDTNETYHCMFDWSDIAQIPNLYFDKGTYDDMFYFRFGRYAIPAGHYEFDPLFGITTEGGTDFDIENICRAVVATMDAVNGKAINLTAFLSETGTGTESVKGALYDTDLNLIATTNEVEVAGLGVWYNLSFSTHPTLNASAVYYLAVFGEERGGSTTANAIGYSTAPVNNMFADSAVYDAFPDPLDDSLPIAAILSLYCAYYEVAGAAKSWKTLSTWNGTVYNTSHWLTHTTWNGTVWNISTFPWYDNFTNENLLPFWVESTNAGSNAQELSNDTLNLNSSASISAFVRSYYSRIPKNTQLIIFVQQHCTDAGFKLCPTIVASHQWDVYSEADWYNFQMIAGNILSPSKKKAGGAITQVGGDSPALTPPYWIRIAIDNTTIYFDYADQTNQPSNSEWIPISNEAYDIGTGINQAVYSYSTAYNTPTTGNSTLMNFSWTSYDRRIQWIDFVSWNGTLYNSSQWLTLTTWNGTVYNTTAQLTWQQLTSWNGTLYNTSRWLSTTVWNGTLYNFSHWLPITTWNGTLYNQTSWLTTSTWNGTVYNSSRWLPITIWNGTLYNTSYWLLVTVWNGTLYNASRWLTVSTWNGTVYNQSVPSNLTVDGLSSPYNVTFNGTIPTSTTNKVYCNNSGKAFETMEIIIDLNASDMVSSVFFSALPINDTTNETTFIYADNFTLYVSTDNATWGILKHDVGYGLGTFKPEGWTLEWNFTTNPDEFLPPFDYQPGGTYAITSDTTLYARYRLNITSDAVEGIYRNYTTSQWSIYLDNNSNVVGYPWYYSVEAEVEKGLVVAWNTITTWNGTVFNTSHWLTPSTWNGTLYNSSHWLPISTWNGTLYNTSHWLLTTSWNGTLYNATQVITISSWNGTLYNASHWLSTTVWNGTLYNTSHWLLLTSWNGTLYNETQTNTIASWNGTLYNISHWLPISTWNGTLYNTSRWLLLTSWNGTLYNATQPRTISTWNGTLYNSTTAIIIASWNGTLYNTSHWLPVSTWNGTLYNTSRWLLVSSWNGTLYNITSWLSVASWNGTIYNASHWKSTTTWNGTLYNSSHWRSVSAWNGTLFNSSLWTSVTQWNGTLYNTSIWKTLSTWNGTVWNGSVYGWNTKSSWNGCLYNGTGSRGVSNDDVPMMVVGAFLGVLIFYMMFSRIKKRRR